MGITMNTFDLIRFEEAHTAWVRNCRTFETMAVEPFTYVFCWEENFRGAFFSIDDALVGMYKEFERFSNAKLKTSLFVNEKDFDEFYDLSGDYWHHTGYTITLFSASNPNAQDKVSIHYNIA